MDDEYRFLLAQNKKLSGQLRSALGMYNKYKNLYNKAEEERRYLLNDNFRLDTQLAELMEELTNGQRTK